MPNDSFFDRIGKFFLLAAIVAAPWLFGSSPTAGLLVVSGLLGASVIFRVFGLLTGSSTGIVSPAILLGMAAPVLIGLMQIQPLPDSAIRWFASDSGLATRHDLFPETPETLDGKTLARPVAANTLSLTPDLTRRALLLLLPGVLTFWLFASWFPGGRGILLLSKVCLINGAAMTWYALIQVAVAGNPFRVPGGFENSLMEGPFPFFQHAGAGMFLYRNYYAAWADISLLAGLGVWAHSMFRLMRMVRPGWREWRVPALWTMMLFAIVVGLLFFQVRAGFVGLVAGSAVFVGLCMVRRIYETRFLLGSIAVILFAVILGDLAGADLFSKRIETLFSAEPLSDQRILQWKLTVPRYAEFPALGWGLGSFPWLKASCYGSDGYGRRELLSLTDEHSNSVWVELLLGTGVVGLAIYVAGLLVLVRAGLKWMAVAHPRFLAAGPIGSLAAIVGFAIHASGEYLGEVPAVTILFGAIAGSLAGTDRPASSGRGRWLALPLSAVLLIAGFAQVSGSYDRWTAQGLRTQAAELADRTPDRPLERVRLLRQALRHVPDSAMVYYQIGDAFRDHALGQAGASRQAFLAEALTNYVASRDRNPLMGQANLRIAALRDLLQTGDTRERYLARAAMTLGYDPYVWYASALEHLKHSHPEWAWPEFRRSLERADQFLPQILAETRSSKLSDAEILREVLPARSSIVREAMNRRYPKPGTPERRGYLERIVEIAAIPDRFNNSTTSLELARIHLELDDDEKARVYFRKIAFVDRTEEILREMIPMLVRLGKWSEAHRELDALIEVKPDDLDSIALRKMVIEKEDAAEKE